MYPFRDHTLPAPLFFYRFNGLQRPHRTPDLLHAVEKLKGMRDESPSSLSLYSAFTVHFVLSGCSLRASFSRF
jgi:hypothetical protein